MTTEISIHALLAESDLPAANLGDGRTIHFYPRSPCGERRFVCLQNRQKRQFLSTLSLRRATVPTLQPRHAAKRFLSTLSLRRATRPGTHQRLGWHFYPRSPCGERRARECARGPLRAISIHALLAESDRIVSVCSDNTSDISIHALLAESDRHISPPTQSRYCISIHALLAESDHLR